MLTHAPYGSMRQRRGHARARTHSNTATRRDVADMPTGNQPYRTAVGNADVKSGRTISGSGRTASAWNAMRFVPGVPKRAPHGPVRDDYNARPSCGFRATAMSTREIFLIAILQRGAMVTVAKRFFFFC